jgi:RNA-binding protein
MKIELSPIARQALKGQAHSLDPLVIIGDNGLTANILREIDRTLKAHELIKVRANSDDRSEREQWMSQICNALVAAPVQIIGKTLVIWRENPEKARIRAREAMPPQKPREARMTRHQEEMRASGQMKKTSARQATRKITDATPTSTANRKPVGGRTRTSAPSGTRRRARS